MIKSLSRGTTIVSCPYKDGIIVATDTLATDPSTFQKYYVPRKSDMFKGLGNEIEILISGAGSSCGTQLVAIPALRAFRQGLEKYKIDLNKIQKVQTFVDVFNSLMASEFLASINNLQMEVLNSSKFILTVKTQKLLFSFEVTFTGGDCTWRNEAITEKSSETFTNLGGIGSGCRYMLGALLSESLKKPFQDWGKEELIDWFKKNFSKVIEKDLGSSTASGMYLTILDRTQKTETLTFCNNLA